MIPTGDGRGYGGKFVGFEKVSYLTMKESACFCCGETEVDPVASLMRCEKEEVRRALRKMERFNLEKFDAG